MDLHDAQTEHRRAWKRERYRKTLPLSAYKRIMAVTIWWEAGKLVCMALRYLETEYLATRTRCGITGDGQATGVSAHGVAHPHAVPDHWRALFLESIAGLTDEQQAALDHPEGKKLQYQAKAKKFLMEVALVDYVLAKNQRGLAVSSRAVLARKGYLLDPLTVESHTRLQKLPRKGLKWVARWQKRHGLTRGRFRLGCGLTPEQQSAKVPGINTHFSFTGTRFVHVPVCFFRHQPRGHAVRILDPPSGFVFRCHHQEIIKGTGPNSGLQDRTHLVNLGTGCFLFLRWSLLPIVQRFWSCLGPFACVSSPPRGCGGLGCWWKSEIALPRGACRDAGI